MDNAQRQAAATKLRELLFGTRSPRPLRDWMADYGPDVLAMLEAEPCPLADGWHCQHAASPLGPTVRVERDAPLVDDPLRGAT